MDDLKRAIYMLARTLIEKELKIDPEYEYGICIALQCAAVEFFGEGVISFDEIPEWFHEFTSLNDGQEWTYESKSKEFYAYTPKVLKYWWRMGIGHKSIYGKKHPRISMLDHILSKRG